MSWRKKVNKDSPNVEKQYANWVAQACMLALPNTLNLISGRGSTKTTEFQVERLIEMAYDMPGAPAAWVSDTYSNLQKNVLPMIEEGLDRKGLKEGIHYVIGKIPQKYAEDEKPDLPSHLKKYFWTPFNKIVTYKHTLVFFTGFNLTFGSLDRPASLAGRSYVHVFGDEVKYFPEHKIGNILKAVRGYKLEYGESPFYRGRTFTTDMPNTANIGEHDWIINQAKNMNAEAILLAIQTGMVMNEALQEWLVAKEENDRENKIKKRRTYERWYDRWVAARKNPDAKNFFFIASSYINSDILEPEWFKAAAEDDLGDLQTAVLSMKPNLESQERFYASLAENHFYIDGKDDVRAELFGIKDKEDCSVLKYLNKNRVIEAGMDFGNMMSLAIGQPVAGIDARKQSEYRVLKFMYVLSPDWIREIADEFVEYFKPHKEKTLHLYYDRAGNNFKKQKQDLATQMKDAVEKDKDGKRTGWRVVLMSEGQGNIGVNEEYIFMQDLLSGNNRKLPKVHIDMYECKSLKCSLELAPAKKNTKGQMVKNKSSEKMPVKDLPFKSTNPSDSFKYLMMRREWRVRVNAGRRQSAGDPTIRG